MGDSKGSGTSNFSAGYLIGTPVSQSYGIIGIPELLIPETLALLTEGTEEKKRRKSPMRDPCGWS
jgi:hypothetical protein